MAKARRLFQPPGLNFALRNLAELIFATPDNGDQEGAIPRGPDKLQSHSFSDAASPVVTQTNLPMLICWFFVATTSEQVVA